MDLCPVCKCVGYHHPNCYNQKGRNHGLSGTAEYTAWKHMKARCNRKSHPYFHNYGGRGIRVCDRWQNSFAAFYYDMGPRPSKRHTLERMDNEKGYDPDNCCWATHEVQHSNKRSNVRITAKGKTQTITQWAAELGMKPNTIITRIRKYGWDEEKAITTPIRWTGQWHQ